MIGHWEILLIFLVVLLFFGGRKIPEIARGLGKGLREFKKAKDEIADSLDDTVAEPPPKTGRAPSTNERTPSDPTKD